VVVAGDPAHRGGRAVVLLVFSLAFLALAALTGQPKGPAKILVISKEWSSDRRRAASLLARRRSVCPAPPRAPTQHPPLGL